MVRRASEMARCALAECRKLKTTCGADQEVCTHPQTWCTEPGGVDAAECCELTWNYSHLAAVMLSFAFARRVVLRKASKAETCMQAQNYGDDGY